VAYQHREVLNIPNRLVKKVVSGTCNTNLKGKGSEIHKSGGLKSTISSMIKNLFDNEQTEGSRHPGADQEVEGG